MNVQTDLWLMFGWVLGALTAVILHTAHGNECGCHCSACKFIDWLGEKRD